MKPWHSRSMMNLKSILLGLTLMVIGVLIVIGTFGFGLLCVWPIIILGFILFILGFFMPSQPQFPFGGGREEPSHQREVRRICSNCKKQMPLDADRCPHCGKTFKYRKR